MQAVDFPGNWLRALKRSVIADNGKELVVPSPVAYLKDNNGPAKS